MPKLGQTRSNASATPCPTPTHMQASAWRGKEWLIESGLQPGERVVVEGFFRILPGVKVHAIPYQEEKTASVHQSEEPIQQAAP